MSNLINVPDVFEPDENIARIIFSPSMIENNQVAPSAFFMDNLQSGPEGYISVWRSNYQTPSPENISFGSRVKGDSLAGYASMTVELCQSTRFENYETFVRPHKSKKNPVHAGIHINRGSEVIKGHCYEPEYLMLATLLAKNCTLTIF